MKISKNIASRMQSIEEMLIEEHKEYESVSSTVENILEGKRVNDSSSTIENKLDKCRKECDVNLPNQRLDKNKKTVGVDYRNEKASAGNVGKLEEQRLSGDKNSVVEKEKYKKANK